MDAHEERSNLNANLAELQVQSLHVVASIAGLSGYVALIWASAVAGNDALVPAGAWAVGALLIIGAAVSFALKDRHVHLAGHLLVISSMAAVVCALITFRELAITYAFILPVTFASVLLAPAIFALLATGVAAFILGLGRHLLDGSMLSEALVPAGIIALVAIGSWLSARNLHTALAWVWNGYEEARKNQDRAREGQRELRRALKALDEATARLERLNYMLTVALDQAEEARRLKQQFAQTISHELRTPLNLIVGFAEIMAHSPEYYGLPLPPAYVRDLGIVYRNARHLQGLVDDVLDLARIEAAQMGLAPEAISPQAIVEETASTVRSLVEAHGLALRIETEPALPLLWMDPLRIRQVLLNLISNAVRFTERGSITVSVRQDGGDVVFAVADTGVGIPPESQERIFREFEQVQDGVSRGGAGLGLAISRQFVLLHGGRIWLESAEGRGSTFRFSLPIDRAVSSERVPRAVTGLDALASAHHQTGPEPTLLAVTHSPSAATMLKRYLRGFRVAVASDLEQAHQTAAQLMPQAVVIDQSYQLDAEALGELSRAWGSSPVPVVMCPLPGEERLRQRLRVDGYLIKPVSQDDLWDVLRRVGDNVDRVLVVDDDQDFALYISRLLEDGVVRRYHVAVARSGTEALDLLDLYQPDLVLLDLVMPNMTGFEVIQRVRSNPRWERLPMIVVSGQDEVSDGEAVPGQMVITRAEGLKPSEIVRWLQSVADTALTARAAR